MVPKSKVQKQHVVKKVLNFKRKKGGEGIGGKVLLMLEDYG